MYKCEEYKQHEKDYPSEPSLCGHCKMFMHEADACLEDSMLTPLMYAIGKKTKPCHYVDSGPIYVIQTVCEKTTGEKK